MIDHAPRNKTARAETRAIPNNVHAERLNGLDSTRWHHDTQAHCVATRFQLPLPTAPALAGGETMTGRKRISHRRRYEGPDFNLTSFNYIASIGRFADGVLAEPLPAQTEQGTP